MTTATIHWHKVVCKEPGNYLGWPTVAQTPSGELLVVFSGGREEHVCPYGKTELVRSTDGGETWSKPVTINDTPLDDRDAGIVAMKSGAVVMSWFTSPWEEGDRTGYWSRYSSDQIEAWKRHADNVRPEADRQGLGHRAWTRRSTDGGQTWEPPVDSLASSPHGPVELSDGRLLFLGNARPAGQKLSESSTIIAVESTDEGQSWSEIGTVMPIPTEGASYDEPHVMEMEDGTLICLARYEPPDPAAEDYYMRQSESTDGGRTWTQPHPANMWGYPPHLIRLSNGDGLATYGHRRPPYGQRACVYQNTRGNLLGGGSSGNWDIANAVVLRDDAENDDLGYPATVELSPGEMLTVYYQIDRPGEKPSIMATRWSLEM